MNNEISKLVRRRNTKWYDGFLFLHAEEICFKFWIPRNIRPQIDITKAIYSYRSKT